MPIIRCESQRKHGEGLLERYRGYLAGDSKDFKLLAETMISWVERLNEEFPVIDIFGLTSHERLVLIPQDDWTLDWYVIIFGVKGRYQIEYLLPQENVLQNEYFKMKTDDFEEAIRMTKLGMKNSKGWPDLILD